MVVSSGDVVQSSPLETTITYGDSTQSVHVVNDDYTSQTASQEIKQSYTNFVYGLEF